MHSLLFNHDFIHITASGISLSDDETCNQEIIIKRGTTSEFYRVSVEEDFYLVGLRATFMDPLAG